MEKSDRTQHYGKKKVQHETEAKSRQLQKENQQELIEHIQSLNLKKLRLFVEQKLSKFEGRMKSIAQKEVEKRIAALLKEYQDGVIDKVRNVFRGEGVEITQEDARNIGKSQNPTFHDVDVRWKREWSHPDKKDMPEFKYSQGDLYTVILTPPGKKNRVIVLSTPTEPEDLRGKPGQVEKYLQYLEYFKVRVDELEE